MRLSAKEWREHVSRQSESGLNPPEYCQRNGLAVANFYYWRQRLRARKSPLIPVVVKPSSEGQRGSLAIRLPNGIQIALENIAAGQDLRSIITTLMEVGS